MPRPGFLGSGLFRSRKARCAEMLRMSSAGASTAGSGGFNESPNHKLVFFQDVSGLCHNLSSFVLNFHLIFVGHL